VSLAPPPAGGPTRGRGRHRDASAIAATVVPVAEALTEDARRSAEAVLAAAERDARAELARANDVAQRMLAEARADGTRAASEQADLDLAVAARQARAAVLAARRAAYDALRRRALELLEQRATSPSGRRLGDLLEHLARARVGPSARVHRAGPGSLDVTATSGNRRAVIGPAQLVDDALRTMADEVATLWS